MKILENTSHKSYNTFGIDVKARFLAEYNSVDELKELLQSETVRQNRLLHIGGGSNLLFLNDFEGIVLHSEITIRSPKKLPSFTTELSKIMPF